MASIATPMTPEDNRELLAAVAAAAAASRANDERALFESKRDIVIAFSGHPVLVAVADGQPLSEPGPTGHVMIAFSDDEAASAWAAGRHPAAPAPETMTSPESGSSDRKGWLESLREGGANAVVLNPAGPLGSIVHADELRTLRPRLLRRGGRQAEHPWLDLGARASERDRAGRLLEALAAAIMTGNRAAFDRVTPELPTLNRLGSLMWAAELQTLSGRKALGDGQTQDGLHQMIYGSFAWGRFGDPYRCTDGLLEAAQLLLDQPADSGDWRTTYLEELADVLERIRTGYRDGNVARLLATARRGR
jgi:hypothetical protein